MVSPLHANGNARSKAHAEPGVPIADAEQDKEHRYPELVGSNRCKFVVSAQSKKATIHAWRWEQDSLFFRCTVPEVRKYFRSLNKGQGQGQG